MATQFLTNALLQGGALTGAIVDVGVVTNLLPTASINTSTFARVNNTYLTFNKNQSNTRLVIMVVFTGFAGNVGFSGFQQIEYAVQIDGTNFVAGFYNFNVAQNHRQMVGVTVASGLTFGTKTIWLQARVVSAGGTSAFTCDAGDRASILCFEISA